MEENIISKVKYWLMEYLKGFSSKDHKHVLSQEDLSPIKYWILDKLKSKAELKHKHKISEVIELEDKLKTINDKIDVVKNKKDNVTQLVGMSGRGITSITKTGTTDLVDTYTILYSDSSTSTFQTTNGSIGSDGDTPYIQGGYWWIDGVNTGVKAEGVDGKTAYQSAITGGYTGTEAEFNAILSKTSGSNTGDQDLSSYLQNISGQDLSTADNTISQFITLNDIPPTDDALFYLIVEQEKLDGYTQTSTMENNVKYTYIRDADNIVIETIKEEL